MAIILSTGVGTARKSVGVNYYRRSRGRTILCQKPAVNAARKGYTYRRALFTLVTRFMASVSTDIEVSFSKTVHGSARNYFLKVNYSGLTAALSEMAEDLVVSGVIPSDGAIATAIGVYAAANPTSLYRVRLQGFQVVYLTGAWSSADNPVSGGGETGLGVGTATINGMSAPVALSSQFYAGSVITRNAGTLTITASSLNAGVVAADLSYLNSSGAPLSTQPSISVTSSAVGSLVLVVGAVSGAYALKVGSIYIRLTSAYTGGGEAPDPTA